MHVGGDLFDIKQHGGVDELGVIMLEGVRYCVISGGECLLSGGGIGRGKVPEQMMNARA